MEDALLDGVHDILARHFDGYQLVLKGHHAIDV